MTPENKDVIAAYFARLRRALGAIPTGQADEAERELWQHLEALIGAYRDVGLLPGDAVEEALGQLGDPDLIGRRLNREWLLKMR